eukprot:1154765-Pelagomonas_calceolata.AAC.4
MASPYFVDTLAGSGVGNARSGDFAVNLRTLQRAAEPMDFYISSCDRVFDLRSKNGVSCCVNREEGPFAAPGTAYQRHLCVMKDWLRQFFSDACDASLTCSVVCGPTHSKRAWQMVARR